MQNHTLVEAVLFDMDGLLFDTETGGRRAWEQALSEHGFTLTEALYRQFVGRDMRHRERILMAHFGPGFPFSAVKDRRLTFGDQQEIAHGVPLKPGARELLEALAARGLPIGLATGTVRPRAERRLESVGLRAHFRAIVAGDEVANGKPAPDIFLAASRLLGVAPTACLVFEDACVGVQAAADAGMRVVMVPDLEPPTEEAARLAFRVLPSLNVACERLDLLLGKRAPSDSSGAST